MSTNPCKLGLGILVASVLGCQYSPICNDITKVAPTQLELLGTYHLNKLVGMDEKNLGIKRVPETITLNGDFTFTLFYPRDVAAKNGISTEITGTFKIAETDACGRTGWGLELSPPLSIEDEVLCFDEGVKHRLAIEFGDPDAGQYAVYVSN